MAHRCKEKSKTLKFYLCRMIDVRAGVEIPTVLGLKRDYEEERKLGER